MKNKFRLNQVIIILFTILNFFKFLLHMKINYRQLFFLNRYMIILERREENTIYRKKIVFMNNYRGRNKYVGFYWLKSLDDSAFE